MAVPAGMAAAKTVVKKAIDQTLSIGEVRNRAAETIAGEDFAADQEKEQCALEHRSDAVDLLRRGGEEEETKN